MLLTGAVLLAALQLQVPFVPQAKDTCGAASLAMVLRYWDVEAEAPDIARELLEPSLHGIPGSRLAAFAKDHGLLAMAYAGDSAQLKDYVAKGRPLIVAWQVGGRRYHDVVVTGFDSDRRELVVNDPARGAGRRVSESTFEKRWAGAGHWTLLVLPQEDPR